MKIDITGDPGTGNTYMEIHIGSVHNFNPNLTTVNYNYNGASQKPTKVISELPHAERELLKVAILQYVAKLAQYVSNEWKNRYVTLWKNILAIPEVEAEVFNPGRQKGTTFNRNLIANILYLMCNENVFTEKNATTLTVTLENSKDHSVRSQLGQYPPSDIREKVMQLIAPAVR